MSGTTTVCIDNTYVDGEGDGTTITTSVDLPTPPVDEDLDDWFNDTVFDHTGTGRDDDADVLYEAKIVASSRPELVGRSFEWI